VRTTGILGTVQDESALAEIVARQWLDRYGVVARDWWRREKPAVSWRAIYRELKRLEFRGDIRRGYFVRGLAGAQFALPSAVELLRAGTPVATSPNGDGAAVSPAPVIVMSVSDPANALTLPTLSGSATESPSVALARRRARSALLITRAGEVLLVAESRGRRITIRPGATTDDVAAAARALAQRLVESGDRRHDPTVETIDGVAAATSPFAAAFGAAGFRATAAGLRFYAPPR
jgi:ATP-dependent Lhr-like helicase